MIVIELGRPKSKSDICAFYHAARGGQRGSVCGNTGVMATETVKTKAPDTGWTLFWDMHSGGSAKVEPYDKIYIEMPQAAAESYFEQRFGRDPYEVTCDCCGEDYSVSFAATLDEISAYHRGCAYETGVGYVDRPCYADTTVVPVQEYEARPDVLVIRR